MNLQQAMTPSRQIISSLDQVRSFHMSRGIVVRGVINKRRRRFMKKRAKGGSRAALKKKKLQSARRAERCRYGKRVTEKKQ